jgi:uncharacterized membrane protein
LFRSLRRYLLAGLILWVPLLVTFLIVRTLIRLVDRTLVLLPPPWRPDELLGFHVPGLGLLLAVLILLLSGLFAANIVGKRLVEAGDSLLARIPLVRSIYSAAKQVVETLFSDKSTSFKQVMLVEYPRKGIWSLCFQTAEQLDEVQARTAKDVVCVFVPTAPNPTSGYIVFAAREDVIPLSMSVDDGLKVIFSVGVVVPRWTSPDEARASLAPPPGPA